MKVERNSIWKYQVIIRIQYSTYCHPLLLCALFMSLFISSRYFISKACGQFFMVCVCVDRHPGEQTPSGRFMHTELCSAEKRLGLHNVRLQHPVTFVKLRHLGSCGVWEGKDLSSVIWNLPRMQGVSVSVMLGSTLGKLHAGDKCWTWRENRKLVHPYPD